MTIQEVKQLDKDSYQIIDIRDDNEIAHGAIPGAVALKVEEIAENPLVDKSKKLVICCSRGKYSQEVVPELVEKGFDAVSLKGGYIAWLMDLMREDQEKDISADVEKSIRKSSANPSGANLQKPSISMNWLKKETALQSVSPVEKIRC